MTETNFMSKMFQFSQKGGSERVAAETLKKANNLDSMRIKKMKI